MMGLGNFSTIMLLFILLSRKRIYSGKFNSSNGLAPYSPDLNPTENLWGDMVRYVYAEGRQFHSIEGLKEAIVAALDEIPLDYLQNLVSSMIHRVSEIIINEEWVN